MYSLFLVLYTFDVVMKIKQKKKKSALSCQTAELNTQKHENSKTAEYGANIETKKIVELGEKKAKKELVCKQKKLSSK